MLAAEERGGREEERKRQGPRPAETAATQMKLGWALSSDSKTRGMRARTLHKGRMR